MILLIFSQTLRHLTHPLDLKSYQIYHRFINYRLFDRGDQCVDSFHHQKFLFDLPLIRQLFPLTKTFTRNPYFEGGGTHKYFPKWPFSISKKSCL